MRSDRSFISPDDIRAGFAEAMSRMYRTEVPAYGTLLDLVAQVNAETIAHDPALADALARTGSLDRIGDERHGAIRLGTAAELATMRRLFAVMGMAPVGYYDLSPAGIPVHSTAFRPVGEKALKRNPFRVFTSLLRLELIRDEALRAEAQAALARRDIFSPKVRDLLETAERDGGLGRQDAALFVSEALETFRWHDRASVPKALYERLHAAHRLLADVVSFRGPHINHLTPRTLDIDSVQELMPQYGIAPKETIEGPPRRAVPILLRQTSFKALEEPVAFQDEDGAWVAGTHTARFGEIEQRGAALTPKGRRLYDELLAQAQAEFREAGGSVPWQSLLAEVFRAFPDTRAGLRAEGLAYFEYTLTPVGRRASLERGWTGDIDALIAQGLVDYDPIVYEDFLPVSAAGIFRSNLGDRPAEAGAAGPAQRVFEEALGCPVADEFALYAAIEAASIERCLNALTPRSQVA